MVVFNATILVSSLVLYIQFYTPLSKCFSLFFVCFFNTRLSIVLLFIIRIIMKIIRSNMDLEPTCHRHKQTWPNNYKC